MKHKKKEQEKPTKPKVKKVKPKVKVVLPAKPELEELELPELFSLKLKHGGDIYESTGATIFDALSAIPLNWVNVVIEGTFIVSKDGKSYEHFLFAKQLKRILSNELTREMFAQNLLLLFNAEAK